AGSLRARQTGHAPDSRAGRAAGRREKDLRSTGDNGWSPLSLPPLTAGLPARPATGRLPEGALVCRRAGFPRGPPAGRRERDLGARGCADWRRGLPPTERSRTRDAASSVGLLRRSEFACAQATSAWASRGWAPQAIATNVHD